MLQAALELFRNKGIDAVTVRALASAVQLSPMALYRYFPEGRGEVLAAIRGRGFEDLATHLAGSLRGVHHPIDRVVAVTLAGVEFAMDRAPLYRLMFEVTQPEEGESYLATRRKAAWKVVQDAFDPALAEGLLRGERELVPQIFFAAVHGAILFEYSRQPYPNRRLHRLVPPMLEMLLRGAGAAPSAIRRARRQSRERISALPRSEGSTS
jgi:AcrR family transcriptional regulator